ncbi:MAG: crossover junction endodeoxyribonuclease RuvC [Nitriliruptoraceae bacterium]
MAGAMLVLGVDPGLTRCGLGLVTGPADRPAVTLQECVRTGADTALERRLLRVHDAILEVIEAHRPDAVAVERVLFSSNVRTAMATGQAAGAALLAAARAGVPVASYSPSDVKLTVAGAGDADKEAVTRLVTAQLGLATAPRPADVADALAVALTHLARTRIAALTADTPAARLVATAHADAGRSERGGWEAHLAARGLLPHGAHAGQTDGEPPVTTPTRRRT